VPVTYRERHWWIFEIDFCGLDGDVVGFECPIGCIDTRDAQHTSAGRMAEGAIA